MQDWLNLIDSEMEKTKKIILSYPWEDKAAYALWLAQTYNMVCYSTRLVGLAGSLLPLGREELHARFIDHSKEERGHQKICALDVKNLGFELSDLKNTASAYSLFQIQYFWIQVVNPVSFFGYTFALESLAEKFGGEVAQRVLNAHGPKATKFLKLHAEDDQQHIVDAHAAFSFLKSEELQCISENFKICCELYRAMLIECMSEYKNIKSVNQLAS
jgi:hypothetical protein